MRPILTMSAKAWAFERRAACRCSSAGHQLARHLLAGRDVHGGREGVVRGLAAVDVVVRVDRVLAAAPTGQDLVGPARRCTSLAFMLLWVPEPVCQTTSGNSPASLPSTTSCAACAIASASLGSRPPSPLVHPRRGQLDDAERPDEGGRHALAADAEVLQAALGLGAPVVVGRDLDRPEGVRLHPHVALARHARLSSSRRCRKCAAAARAVNRRWCPGRNRPIGRLLTGGPQHRTVPHDRLFLRETGRC